MAGEGGVSRNDPYRKITGSMPTLGGKKMVVEEVVAAALGGDGGFWSWRGEGLPRR
jgi:hypothetical protein